jgi:hypothetical protein
VTRHLGPSAVEVGEGTGGQVVKSHPPMLDCGWVKRRRESLQDAIPNFYAKTEYSSHVCPRSFIPHTQTKSVHIYPNVTNKVYLLHK